MVLVTAGSSIQETVIQEIEHAGLPIQEIETLKNPELTSIFEKIDQN
jgi:hypothetical protein